MAERERDESKRERGQFQQIVVFVFVAIAGLGAAVIYGLVPIDLIPELFLGPFLGYLDDLVVAVGTGYLILRGLIPKE